MCMAVFETESEDLVVRARLFSFLPLRSEHQHLQSNLTPIIVSVGGPSAFPC